MLPSYPLPFAACRRGGSEVIRVGELVLPSPTAALRSTGPAPHLGSTVELTVDVGADPGCGSWPWIWELTLDVGVVGEPASRA